MMWRWLGLVEEARRNGEDARRTCAGEEADRVRGGGVPTLCWEQAWRNGGPLVIGFGWGGPVAFVGNFMKKGKGSGSYNSLEFNSCNLTQIRIVIISLNQVWNKLNQILSKLKSISEFNFSFEFHSPLGKVSNAKVVPNIPIYLQENFHKDPKYFS
jgi:hypothetical protein